MALFTGRDQRLPLLTQIVQLWPYPESETDDIEETSARGMAGSELDQFICQYMKSVGRQVKEKFWTDTDEAKDPLYTKEHSAEEQLLQLADDLSSVSTMLEWAYSKSTTFITAEGATTLDVDHDVERINEFLDRRWIAPAVRLVKLSMSSNRLSPVLSYKKIELSISPFPVEEVGLSMLDTVGSMVARDFAEVMQQTRKLGRCHECSHVFVENRKLQRYCSRRCAARVGQRLRQRRGKHNENLSEI